MTEKNVELEDQFILRLPPESANEMHSALATLKSKKFKRQVSIAFDHPHKFPRSATVKVCKHQLYGKLVDLPCVVESCKTSDKKQLFKTADVSQMLVCQMEPFESKNKENEDARRVTNNKHPHGLATSLKNVRKGRFRRVLKNKEDPEQIADVEKEVLWLLRADHEAISTKYEICNESKYGSDPEHVLFGETVSD